MSVNPVDGHNSITALVTFYGNALSELLETSAQLRVKLQQVEEDKRQALGLEKSIRETEARRHQEERDKLVAELGAARNRELAAARVRFGVRRAGAAAGQDEVHEVPSDMAERVPDGSGETPRDELCSESPAPRPIRITADGAAALALMKTCASLANHFSRSTVRLTEFEKDLIGSLRGRAAVFDESCRPLENIDGD